MKIKAFTILELLIVIAITGILVSFFYTSLNRFNEYMYRKVHESETTNTFHLFRSNLWQEIFTSDSIHIYTNQFVLYHSQDSIVYRKNDQEQIERFKAGKEVNIFALEFESAKTQIIQDESFLNFTFVYEGEKMNILAPCYPVVQNTINTYFHQLP